MESFIWSISIGLFCMGFMILAVLLWNVKLQNRNEKKDEITAHLIQKNEELEANCKVLSETADRLNQFYDFSTTFIERFFSDYEVYKHNAVDNIIQHKYAGEDATIRHFLKETLEFDKRTRVKIEEFNKNVSAILGQETEDN